MSLQGLQGCVCRRILQGISTGPFRTTRVLESVARTLDDTMCPHAPGRFCVPDTTQRVAEIPAMVRRPCETRCSSSRSPMRAV